MSIRNVYIKVNISVKTKEIARQYIKTAHFSSFIFICRETLIQRDEKAINTYSVQVVIFLSV